MLLTFISFSTSGESALETSFKPKDSFKPVYFELIKSKKRTGGKINIFVLFFKENFFASFKQDVNCFFDFIFFQDCIKIFFIKSIISYDFNNY
jgi:hypothetical protein